MSLARRAPAEYQRLSALLTPRRDDAGLTTHLVGPTRIQSILWWVFLVYAAAGATLFAAAITYTFYYGAGV